MSVQGQTEKGTAGLPCPVLPPHRYVPEEGGFSRFDNCSGPDAVTAAAQGEKQPQVRGFILRAGRREH